MQWYDCLLQKHMWQDTQGNTLCISDCDFEGTKQSDGLYFYLDEGFHCGGRYQKIEYSLSQIQKLLLGCGKQELWTQVLHTLSEYGIENNEQ